MAMTAAVKDELSRLSVTKPCCRKAEVSSLLRFAGGLHIAAGKVLIEVELDTSQSARRLKKISQISTATTPILQFSLPADFAKAHVM